MERCWFMRIGVQTAWSVINSGLVNVRGRASVCSIRHLSGFKRRIRLMALMAALGGCGRYTVPLPPEHLSPAAVEFQEITAAEAGITLNWLAPTKDNRGKRLDELNGYVVYRKELNNAASAVDPAVPFSEVQRVDDSSIARLEKKKEEAVRAGTPVRRVSLSGDERRVSVTDVSVTPGHTYLYKVVPFSFDGVDGGYDRLIRVVFTGSGSSIAVMPVAAVEEVQDSSVNTIDQEITDTAPVW